MRICAAYACCIKGEAHVTGCDKKGLQFFSIHVLVSNAVKPQRSLTEAAHFCWTLYCKHFFKEVVLQYLACSRHTDGASCLERQPSQEGFAVQHLASMIAPQTENRLCKLRSRGQA